MNGGVERLKILRRAVSLLNLNPDHLTILLCSNILPKSNRPTSELMYFRILVQFLLYTHNLFIILFIIFFSNTNKNL